VNNLPLFCWQQKNWPNLTWDKHRLQEPLSQARRRQERFLAKANALRFKQGFLFFLPATKLHNDSQLSALHDATTNYAQPLTAKRVQKWHSLLFAGSHVQEKKTGIGEWRGLLPMHIATYKHGKLIKVHYKAPPGERLEDEMQQFFNWFEESAESLDGLVRAGLALYRFLIIHPFEDGNGRIGRILADMALGH
jgi:Fic family protein